MKRDQIEYVFKRMLPDGWFLEELLIAAVTDDFNAIVRHPKERMKVIEIPGRISNPMLLIGDAAKIVIDAIDMAFGIGRFATTPIVTPSPDWSPYP